MLRRAVWLGIFGMTAAAATGCGSGLSTEEATQRCDQEKRALGQLMTQASYDQCIACYEECGDECERAATPSPTYSCPAE